MPDHVTGPVTACAALVCALTLTAAVASPPPRADLVIVSPADGARVDGPVRIHGTWRGVDHIRIGFDAGEVLEARVLDPKGDGRGTWHYDWDPSGHAGMVEITVRASSIDDRRSVWAPPRTVRVEGPAAVRAGPEKKTASPGDPPPPGPRRRAPGAVWIWEEATVRLLESPGARHVLAAFLEGPAASAVAPRTIYLYADRYDGAHDLVDRPALYRDLVSWARARGWVVHALLGSAYYFAPMYAYARYHEKAVGLVDAVIDYNTVAPPEARFDGIQIDIEPYVLPDWDEAPEVPRQYLDMLDAMVSRARARAGESLDVGPAIPRWFDRSDECLRVAWRGRVRTCADHVQDIADYIAIMDYRDVAEGSVGIIEQAAAEIAYGQAIGRPVVIGVETADVSSGSDPEAITFHEEGSVHMAGEIAKARAAFEKHASFAGFAVDHYDAWRRMRTRWSPEGTVWSSPVPDAAPPEAPAEIEARIWDRQRIDLRWARAGDDVMVDHYEIHRATRPGFVPGEATRVATVDANRWRDAGLLPGTTYHHRVLAVDIAGRKGPPSAVVTTTTPPDRGARPMRLAAIAVEITASRTTGRMTVTDDRDRPVKGARVLGYFGGASGRRFEGTSDAQGQVVVTTAPCEAPCTILLKPERILARGRYWAKSIDVASEARGHRRAPPAAPPE